MMDGNKLGGIANALALGGAGFQGKLPEMMKMQADEAMRREALQAAKEAERRRAFAIDTRMLGQHLANNDLKSAEGLLVNRKDMLENLGAKDTNDTDTAFNMLQNGQIDELKNMVKTVDQRFVLEGLIPPVEQAARKLHKVENGRATFLEPDLTVSEEAVKGALSKAGEQLEFSDQRAIVNDIEKLTRSASEVKDAASGLDRLSMTKSNTDQLAAIFAFMKALDPSSVVRDDEQRQVIGTGGVAEAMSGFVSNLMGGGRLSPDVFDAMVRTAKRLANQKIQNTSERVTQILGAFGEDMLSKKATDRIYKIVPTAFYFDDPDMEGMGGQVDRRPASLQTLDEAGMKPKRVVTWGDIQ